MHEASKQQFELMPAPLGERVDACCCVLLYAFVTFLHSSRCLHLASEEEWRSIGETPPVHALRVMVVLPGSFPTCCNTVVGPRTVRARTTNLRVNAPAGAISLHHRRPVLVRELDSSHRSFALGSTLPCPLGVCPLLDIRAHCWSTSSHLLCCEHPPKQPTRWWMSLGPSAHSITWCAHKWRCCCPDATRHAGVAHHCRRSPLTPPY